jgi:predicted RNA binding protein YcfA (HicA-like mRNA interferase family)
MIKRQKGSHIIFFHPVKSGYLVVPFHGSKEVGKGITRDLLLRAGIK